MQVKKKHWFSQPALQDQPSQNLYKKTEAFYLRALALHEKKLGRVNPLLSLFQPKDEKDLILVTNLLEDLGSLYVRQELYKEAEKFYLRSLGILKKTFSITSRGESSLANLYEKQGLNKKAEAYKLRALANMERAWGKNDISVTPYLISLGFFLWRTRSL